jgi:Ca-activated chloride channel family protein
LVKSDSGISEYDYPLNTEKFSSRALKDVTVKISLTCKEPIKTIYSPSHNVDINRESPKHAVIGYEERNVRPDTDFKLMYSQRASELGINLLTYRNSGEDGYFLLLASPGASVKSDAIQAKDITYVLETSGSMAGEKMEQAKKALSFCINSLDEHDRFEIIRFSTEAEPFFNELRVANKENVSKALAFVSKMSASGATAIDEALKQTLMMRKARTKEDAGRPYEVIFLTDGMPTIGETSEDAIVRHVAQLSEGTRVFCFGLGNDVNTHLLDRIADQTGAVSQYVLPQEDIELKLSNFYAKIREPALCNVDVAFVGSGGSEIHPSQVYPKSMPDLFKGQTLLVFGRYSGQGAAAVKISGTVNGEKKEFAADVNFTNNDTTNAFVPQLWATRRVGWLLDEIRLHGESKELKDEVVRLAREFGIVTPYTAYLIIEDEGKRAVPLTSRSFQEMEKDKEASDYSGQFYNSLHAEAEGPAARSGPQAVSNAQNVDTLKDSSNLQQAAKESVADDHGGRGLAKKSQDSGPSAGAPEGYRKAQNYAQQARVINGRAFYQNGNTWTDSNIQAQTQAKRQRIAFNSEEYFNLIKNHPDAMPWLSLGTDVDVWLDDTVYEIRAGA